MNKIINMSGMPKKKRTDTETNEHFCDRAHEIDYVSEKGKLLLDVFFSEMFFYIIKRTEKGGINTPGDTVLQTYDEFKDFLASFDSGRLYDQKGRLFFEGMKAMVSSRYEIRKVSCDGETYLERFGYDTHQKIIDAIWNENGYTEPPDIYERLILLKKKLFKKYDSNTVYTNSTEVHTVIESRATKQDDGYYKVSGKERYYNGPIFEGEAGIAMDLSLQSLFDGKLVIVKDYVKNRYFLMRRYSQLSALWEKTGFLEIKDEKGEMILYCTRDKKSRYAVRTVTPSGQLYLDTQKPCAELLAGVWEKNSFSSKIY